MRTLGDPMKVLVTGASGFIAKHIIKELLANDHEVRASTRSDYSQEQVAALFPGLKLSGSTSTTTTAGLKP